MDSKTLLGLALNAGTLCSCLEVVMLRRPYRPCNVNMHTYSCTTLCSP